MVDADLREFVRDQLERERQERRLRREARSAELEARNAERLMKADVLRIRLEHEREMQRMRLDGEMKLRPTDDSYFSTSYSKGQYRPVSQSHVLKMPKFENKPQLSTVAKYLGVFEGSGKKIDGLWPCAQQFWERSLSGKQSI